MRVPGKINNYITKILITTPVYGLNFWLTSAVEEKSYFRSLIIDHIARKFPNFKKAESLLLYSQDPATGS
jgi:hypothetical protein